MTLRTGASASDLTARPSHSLKIGRCISMEEKSTSAFIDSMEFGMCTLLLGEESFPITIPSKFIPAKLHEGDYMRLCFSPAPDAKHNALDEIENLLRYFDEK